MGNVDQNGHYFWGGVLSLSLSLSVSVLERVMVRG
jgi:hypothetical protein